MSHSQACCVNPLPGSHRQHGRLHTPATGHTDVGKSHACGATVHSQHFILMTGTFICACRLPWISYGREDCIRKWVEPFRENRDLFCFANKNISPVFKLFSSFIRVFEFKSLSESEVLKDYNNSMFVCFYPIQQWQYKGDRMVGYHNQRELGLTSFLML